MLSLGNLARMQQRVDEIQRVSKEIEERSKKLREDMDALKERMARAREQLADRRTVIEFFADAMRRVQESRRAQDQTDDRERTVPMVEPVRGRKRKLDEVA